MKRRLARLKAKFNYVIGCVFCGHYQSLCSITSLSYRKTKLNELHNKFNIPSARKPPPDTVITSLVLDKLASDIEQRNGPNEVAKMIAADGEYVVPRYVAFLSPIYCRLVTVTLFRDAVSKKMRTIAPEGFESRHRANAKHINRGVLTSPGLMAEVSGDGHEKFGTLALDMGPVGFDIYAFREKLCGLGLGGRCVPNARRPCTVCHVYFDTIGYHKSKWLARLLHILCLIQSLQSCLASLLLTVVQRQEICMRLSAH